MSERIFSTQGDVLEFLHAQGLKISRAKLSQDYRAGCLPCMADKRFREEDVLRYAETLKAPATEEKKDKLMKARAEAENLKALLSPLLKAMPDHKKVERVLRKWLDARLGTDMKTLCNDVRTALERMETENSPRAQESLQTQCPAAPESESPQRSEALTPLQYSVQGSALEPYLVTFKGEGQALTAFCSCPAGRRGRTFCKHIASLLKGDASKVVEPSDGLAALASRAADSPLLEKAKAYTPAERRKLQPLTSVSSVKDIAALVESLISGTGLWSEYTTDEDGSEFLTIYLRKMYKNGKPYKNPTPLISISYEPIMYEAVYNELSDDIQNTAVTERAMPYLVDSTNYGKIETAGASFMNKLEGILAHRTS